MSVYPVEPRKVVLGGGCFALVTGLGLIGAGVAVASRVGQDDFIGPVGLGITAVIIAVAVSGGLGYFAMGYRRVARDLVEVKVQDNGTVTIQKAWFAVRIHVSEIEAIEWSGSRRARYLLRCRRRSITVPRFPQEQEFVARLLALNPSIRLESPGSRRFAEAAGAVIAVYAIRSRARSICAALALAAVALGMVLLPVLWRLGVVVFIDRVPQLGELWHTPGAKGPGKRQQHQGVRDHSA